MGFASQERAREKERQSVCIPMLVPLVAFDGFLEILTIAVFAVVAAARILLTCHFSSS